MDAPDINDYAAIFGKVAKSGLRRRYSYVCRKSVNEIPEKFKKKHPKTVLLSHSGK